MLKGILELQILCLSIEFIILLLCITLFLDDMR